MGRYTHHECRQSANIILSSSCFLVIKKGTEFQMFINICNECVLYSSNYMMKVNRKMH